MTSPRFTQIACLGENIQPPRILEIMRDSALRLWEFTLVTPHQHNAPNIGCFEVVTQTEIPDTLLRNPAFKAWIFTHITKEVEKGAN